MQLTFSCSAALIIALVTLLSGLWLIYKQSSPRFFSWSEALVSGLFIGAGIFHLLPDAIDALKTGGNALFFPIMLCLASFIVLFLLEWMVRHQNTIKTGPDIFSGILVMAALSVHSVIGGLAMGLNQQLGDALIIFIAILAHKATDSFALVINLQRAGLSRRGMTALVFAFAWMTPLGIVLAYTLAHQVTDQSLLYWEGVFNALAAGTFIYIGTVEGVGRQLLLARQPEWSALMWMLAGLMFMAVLTLWS